MFNKLVNFLKTEEEKLESVLSGFTKTIKNLEAHYLEVAKKAELQADKVKAEGEKLDALVSHSLTVAKLKAKFSSFLEV